MGRGGNGLSDVPARYWDTTESFSDLPPKKWTVAGATGVRISSGKGLSAEVLAKGEPYLNNAADQDPRLYTARSFSPIAVLLPACRSLLKARFLACCGSAAVAR